MTAIDPVLRLVVILDHDAARGRDLAELAAAAVAGGATMLQVRAKRTDARAYADLVRSVLVRAGTVPVVANDRLDVALAAGAAGCHLGQTDLPIDVARRMSPPGFVLGGSAYTEDEARRAAAQHPDYLGIGPIAATPSKPDAPAAVGWAGFARIRAAAPAIPAVGIGGIDVALAAGARAAEDRVDHGDAEAATRALRATVGA